MHCCDCRTQRQVCALQDLLAWAGPAADRTTGDKLSAQPVLFSTVDKLLMSSCVWTHFAYGSSCDELVCVLPLQGMAENVAPSAHTAVPPAVSICVCLASGHVLCMKSMERAAQRPNVI